MSCDTETAAELEVVAALGGPEVLGSYLWDRFMGPSPLIA